MYTFDPKLTLYIPYINKTWANVNKITDVFHKLQIGNIDYIDFKRSKKNNNVYEGFVYFKTWFDTVQNRNIQNKIFDCNKNNRAKLVYDDPKYWILMKYDNNDKRKSELNQELNQELNKNQINYLNNIIYLTELEIDYLNKINIIYKSKIRNYEMLC